MFTVCGMAQTKKGGDGIVSPMQNALRSITEDAAKAHVYFLADDLLEGREAGRRGSQIARQYIISRIREAGLSPVSGDSFLQPFEAVGRSVLHRRPWL